MDANDRASPVTQAKSGDFHLGAERLPTGHKFLNFGRSNLTAADFGFKASQDLLLVLVPIPVKSRIPHWRRSYTSIWSDRFR